MQMQSMCIAKYDYKIGPKFLCRFGTQNWFQKTQKHMLSMNIMYSEQLSAAWDVNSTLERFATWEFRENFEKIAFDF